MTLYSENEVRNLYTEFRDLKKYTQKLSFFDRLFGIIPFSFPEFDPQLSYFFQKEKTQELAEIFKRERNNPGLTEKKFYFDETYTFTIRPTNSNSALYSNYILSSFLARPPILSEWISQKTSVDKPVAFFLEEANGILNHIEYLLQYEHEKSFKLQCMSVFFRGYFDGFCNRVVGPGKKRKFTELYLYAQGIIYANYIRSLKSALQKSRMPVDLQGSMSLDLGGKLALLNELGLIDFLKARYAGLAPSSFENKLTEMLCLLTNGQAEQKQLVLEIVSAMKSQRKWGID